MAAKVGSAGRHGPLAEILHVLLRLACPVPGLVDNAPTLFRDLRGQGAEERQHRRGRPDQYRTVDSGRDLRGRGRSRLGKRRTCGRKAAFSTSHPCDGKHGLSRPVEPSVRCSRRSTFRELNAQRPPSGLGHICESEHRGHQGGPLPSGAEIRLGRDNLSLRWNRNALISPDRVPPPGRVTPTRRFCR